MPDSMKLPDKFKTLHSSQVLLAIEEAKKKIDAYELGLREDNRLDDTTIRKNVALMKAFHFGGVLSFIVYQLQRIEAGETPVIIRGSNGMTPNYAAGVIQEHIDMCNDDDPKALLLFDDECEAFGLVLDILRSFDY